MSTKRAPVRVVGTPSRRADSGSGRRDELLAIAGKLFATQGFVATTVREIADAAGILSGSLYHHFDSKEAMVDEILSEFLDTQLLGYQRVLDENSDNPVGVLTALVEEAFRSMDVHRDAIAIFQNEFKYLSQFDRFGYLDKTRRDFEKMWLKVLHDGQRTGVFRADLEIKLVYRFIRDTVSISVHWYNPRGQFSSATIARQYLTILCQGILTDS